MDKMRNRDEKLNILPRVTQQLSYTAEIQTPGSLLPDSVILSLAYTLLPNSLTWWQ